jgi:hypothetical protein
VGSIQYVVSYLCAMVLLGQTLNELQTLDYDKILMWKVQFLPIAFDGDVLFELLPILLTAHNPSQIQGMDRKYDGHVWCELVTTNIKISFGLNFRNVRCLGHLRCVQDDCENFVHSTSQTFWCGECAHILILVQMIMVPSIFLFKCKVCHTPPFCVMDCSGWIYYVVNRF